MTLLPGAADVVIVGGGPAGAATAIALRRRGVDTLLLDRAQFPRDKVCGDVILPEAQGALHSLGLDLASLAAQAYTCTGARYVSCGGPDVSGEFRDADGALRPWWMIRRLTFDAWLLDAARRAGAHVVERVDVDDVLRGATQTVCGVRARSSGGARQQVRARVVVGADGASSVVARAVGAFQRRPEHTCLAGRAYVNGLTLPAPYLEIFTTPRTLPGCAWIVPVGDGVASVGIGIVQATANRLGRTPQALFAEMRRESPLLQDRLREAGTIALRGWTLPAATERRRLAGPGWLLVGDAGAMVDPFTGHGIHNALAAGLLAGDAIADALGAANPLPALQGYESRCRVAFGADVARGAWLQWLHARPYLVRAAAAACGRHPGLRATFLALVGHSASRRSLLAPASLARAVAAFRREGAAA